MRAVFVVCASVCFSVFGLELAQKQFDIVNLFRRPPAAQAPVASAREGAPAGASYRWDPRRPHTYLRARERAEEAGLLEPVAAPPAPDWFDGAAPGALWTDVGRKEAHGVVERIDALKPLTFRRPPLGYELTPDNRAHFVNSDVETGERVFDGWSVIDGFGCRATTCDPDAAEAYLFFGCSFTYGTIVGDEETLPHFFSESRGFGKRVHNLGLYGHGPHQMLRDLELGYRESRLGLPPGSVKGVVYTLIDDHVRRVSNPMSEYEPFYILSGGEAFFEGDFMGSPRLGRLYTMLSRSRIYPLLKDRLTEQGGVLAQTARWRLARAVLAKAHRLCLEKFGVPLTVVYWDGSPGIVDDLRAAGIDAVSVDEIFGPDWKAFELKYYVYDRHPSAAANRIIGRFLGERL